MLNTRMPSQSRIELVINKTEEGMHNESATQHGGIGDMPPLSSDYFHALSISERVVVALCGVLVVFTVCLFIEKSVYVLCRYDTPKQVRFKSVQILGIYPAMSLCAFLALCVPRSVTLCHFASLCYLSMAMYNFVMLIDQYFGGKHRVLSTMKGTSVSLRSPPICCCCYCLPAVEVNGKNLRYLKILVLQGVILQPLIGFLAVVLWLDGRLTLGSTNLWNANVHVSYLIAISTLTSVYGLVLCYQTSREALSPLDIGSKYAVLQMIAILFSVQDAVFTIIAKIGVPSQRGILSPMVRSFCYMNMLLVFEMFILSLVARCIYRHPHKAVSQVQSMANHSSRRANGHHDIDASDETKSIDPCQDLEKNDVSMINYFSYGDTTDDASESIKVDINTDENTSMRGNQHSCGSKDRLDVV